MTNKLEILVANLNNHATIGKIGQEDQKDHSKNLVAGS